MFGRKPPKPQPAPPPDLVSEKLLELFYKVYATDRGIHVETLLVALGAMAGFGCQMAVRELIKSGRLDPTGALVEVEAKDGSKYYFGDQINQPLLEAPVSVLKIIAGAAQQAGATTLPDVIEIVRHVTATVGGGDFGRLRLPPNVTPHETPLETLQKHWKMAYGLIVTMSGDPTMTGWYFAGAAQRIIVRAKEVIDPATAFHVVMESAIAMSKVDPKVIGYDPARSPLAQR